MPAVTPRDRRGEGSDCKNPRGRPARCALRAVARGDTIETGVFPGQGRGVARFEVGSHCQGERDFGIGGEQECRTEQSPRRYPSARTRSAAI